MILCKSGSTQGNVLTMQPKSWKSERLGKDRNIDGLEETEPNVSKDYLLILIS